MSLGEDVRVTGTPIFDEVVAEFREHLQAARDVTHAWPVSPAASPQGQGGADPTEPQSATFSVPV
jgi:hypothetical protein